MSDVAAVTTQPGATGSTDTETQFQSLYDAGAFEPEKPHVEQQAVDTNAAAAAQEARNDADPHEEDEADARGLNGQQDGQAQTYASLNDLLTAHKIDPQSVMGLHVTAKIDGVETQVPLEQVLKSYQLEGHVNNKSIELSNQKAALEQERASFRTAAQQVIQQHQAMANVAMQMLNHDFNRIDWNALRVQNPAEFAALQAEYGQRQQQIQGFLAQVQQQASEQAEQQQRAIQQSLAQEHERLLGARPEWRDQAAFTKDRDQMTQYARSLGFQDAELSQIFDHRYMLVLHDAARFRALQAAAPQALKQVRQAPPTAAPGSRTNANPADASRQAAIERFNRNPRDEDAAAAVFQMLG
ncbi:hypothetical protein WJ95_09410 [Burkholderia ubonensis]|uniref:hypothetical protein n=1 Tax=Burkholderia ubonensis TaxID=101571 RepID=UPI000754F19F|nr:hypothetical protein [Burkholderia ubonensis]KVP90714.1 hypothetical protein WJ95_09410 [Burkholderia ubonensis]